MDDPNTGRSDLLHLTPGIVRDEDTGTGAAGSALRSMSTQSFYTWGIRSLYLLRERKRERENLGIVNFASTRYFHSLDQ